MQVLNEFSSEFRARWEGFVRIEHAFAGSGCSARNGKDNLGSSGSQS